MHADTMMPIRNPLLQQVLKVKVHAQDDPSLTRQQQREQTGKDAAEAAANSIADSHPQGGAGGGGAANQGFPSCVRARCSPPPSAACAGPRGAPVGPQGASQRPEAPPPFLHEWVWHSTCWALRRAS
eukprot:6723152-Pyramimonas_sp.AAC.1